ncbi:choice-of-anchor R domain-containing protein, partial [Patiriisocius hiemis]
MKKITYSILCCLLSSVSFMAAQQIMTSTENVDITQTFPLDGSRAVACNNLLPNYTNSAPTGNGTPAQDFETAFDVYDSMAADDFMTPSVGSMVNICEISIIGTAGNTVGDPSNTFIFTIYEDAAGIPGTVVYTETFLTSDVDPDGNGSFTVAPTLSSLLPGSTKYWLSVQADMDFGTSGQFFWSTASDVNGDAWLWQNPGGGFGTTCNTWQDGGNVCGVAGGTGPSLLMDISFIEDAIPVGAFEVCATDNPQAIDDFTSVTSTITLGNSGGAVIGAMTDQVTFNNVDLD